MAKPRLLKRTTTTTTVETWSTDAGEFVIDEAELNGDDDDLADGEAEDTEETDDAAPATRSRR